MFLKEFSIKREIKKPKSKFDALDIFSKRTYNLKLFKSAFKKK